MMLDIEPRTTLTATTHCSLHKLNLSFEGICIQSQNKWLHHQFLEEHFSFEIMYPDIKSIHVDQCAQVFRNKYHYTNVHIITKDDK